MRLSCGELPVPDLFVEQRDNIRVLTPISKLQSQQSAKEVEHEKAVARIQSQHTTKATEHQQELARLKSQMAAKDAEHEKQLTQTRKTVEADAERVQRRTQAEAADFKATISRLEVDLMKVGSRVILSPLYLHRIYR